MLLNDLIKFLEQYKELFPHRQIEIVGDFSIAHEDEDLPVKVEVTEAAAHIISPMQLNGTIAGVPSSE